MLQANTNQHGNQDFHDMRTLELFDRINISIDQAESIVRTNEILRMAGLPSIDELVPAH